MPGTAPADGNVRPGPLHLATSGGEDVVEKASREGFPEDRQAR